MSVFFFHIALFYPISGCPSGGPSIPSNAGCSQEYASVAYRGRAKGGEDWPEKKADVEGG